MKDSSPSKSSRSQAASNPRVRRRLKWSMEQTRKYCEFIGNHRSILQETEKKQKQRIYNKMAAHIGTRSTHQCRSHHQKIIKRHKSIDGFIEMFKKKINSEKKLMSWPKESSDRVQAMKNQKFQLNRSSEHLNDKLKIQQQYRLRDQQNRIHYSIPNFGFRNQIDERSLVQFPNKEPGLWHERVKHNSYNNQMNRHGIPKYILYRFGFEQREMSRRQKIQTDNFRQSNLFRKIPIQKKPLTRYQQQTERRNTFFSNTLSELDKICSQIQNKPTTKHLKVQLPPFKNFQNNPQLIFEYSHQICASILSKTNVDVIDPLIRNNYIELTKDSIKIRGKQNDNFKMQIQCKRGEESQEIDLESEKYVNFSSEEIPKGQINQPVEIEKKSNCQIVPNQIQGENERLEQLQDPDGLLERTGPGDEQQQDQKNQKVQNPNSSPINNKSIRLKQQSMRIEEEKYFKLNQEHKNLKRCNQVM